MLLPIKHTVLPTLLLLLLLLGRGVYAQKVLETVASGSDLTVVDSLPLSAAQSIPLDSITEKAHSRIIPTFADSLYEYSNAVNPPLDSLLPLSAHPLLPDSLSHLPSLPNLASQGLGELPLPSAPSSLPKPVEVKDLPFKNAAPSALKTVQQKLTQERQSMDSLASYPRKLSKVNQAQTYQQAPPLDSAHHLSWDTLAITAAEQSEAWATEQVSKQWKQLPEPLMAEHPQQDAMRSRLTQEAQSFFQADAEKLNQAKAQLTKLKRTYRQVKEQDSVFIKNTSLAGVPVRERLVYGINVNPDRTGLTSWQIRPQLGYQLNQVWTVGLGGQIQAGIRTEPTQLNATGQGGYGFVQRAVARQFLLYTEVAHETMAVVDESPERAVADWKAWVGLGKQLAISDKFALQLLFLWDGLADRRVPVREQFQFRVGLLKLNEH